MEKSPDGSNLKTKNNPKQQESLGAEELRQGAFLIKCSPSQGQNHLTHCGSIPAGCSPVEMYS